MQILWSNYLIFTCQFVYHRYLKQFQGFNLLYLQSFSRNSYSLPFLSYDTHSLLSYIFQTLHGYYAVYTFPAVCFQCPQPFHILQYVVPHLILLCPPFIVSCYWPPSTTDSYIRFQRTSLALFHILIEEFRVTLYLPLQNLSSSEKKPSFLPPLSAWIPF